MVITHPEPQKNEHRIIHALFDAGLACLHVRKPLFSRKSMEEFIRGIDRAFHPKIVLHNHYQWVLKFQLKGGHMSEKYRQSLAQKNQLEKKVKWFKSRGFSVSSSFHDLSALKSFKHWFDYAFISPVFDSISKPGYQANASLTEVGEIKGIQKIALGGIDHQNITIVKSWGYDGAAVLGAVWKDPDHAVERFEEVNRRANFTAIRIHNFLKK